MRLIAVLVIMTSTAITFAAEPISADSVVVKADPAPRFSYWALAGSTVSNHPRENGVWIAHAEGIRPIYYFGDLCRASAFQAFVGLALDQFPYGEFGDNLRTSCTQCAVTSDLRFDRINVFYDEETALIEEVSCG